MFRKNTHNDIKINTMGVPCPPAGRHPTLIKKLFTYEKNNCLIPAYGAFHHGQSTGF